jgi:hypothetical protein
MRLNQKTTRRAMMLTAAAAAMLPLASPKRALAVDRTWDGFFTTQFTLPSNWTSTAVPGAGDIARFMNQAGVNNSLVVLNANYNVAAMSIDGTPGVGAYEFQVQNNAVLGMLGSLSIANGGLGATPVTFNGFQVSAGAVSIGSSGTLNLTGSALLSSLGAMDVQGRLNWSGGSLLNAAGTNLSVNGGMIFNTAGGRGLGNGVTVNLSNGGQFLNTSFFDIGSSTTGGANGTLIINNGTQYTAGGIFTDWGLNPGDTANVTLTGSGSATLAGGLQIGRSGGTANVNLINGGTLNVASLVVGSVEGSHATISLNGASCTLNSLGAASFLNGSTLTTSGGSIFFGGNTTFATGSTFKMGGGVWAEAPGITWAFDGGVGTITGINSRALSNGSTLRITNSGALTSGPPIDVGNSSNGGATGSLIVNSGQFTANQPFSSFVTNWGKNTGDAATVTFENSGVGSYSAGLQIGSAGGAATVTLQSSAQLNTASLVTGVTSGTSDGVKLNLAGGTLNSVGTASIQKGTTISLSGGGGLLLGGNTSFESGASLTETGGTFRLPASGTVSFNGGTASLATGIGIPAGGTLRLTSGGAISSSEFLNIADGLSAGTLLVDGATSSLTVSGSGLSVWGTANDHFASVTVSNSGIVTYPGLYIGLIGASAEVTLNTGGRLNVGSLGSGGAPASSQTINIAGGTLNCIGTANFRQGTTINLSDGSLLFGGDTTIGAEAKLNQTGGTLSFAQNTTLNVNGGSATVSGINVQNGMTANITAGGNVHASRFFDVANGSGNGTLLIDGFPSQVTSSGFTLSSWGTLVGQTANVTISEHGLAQFGRLDMATDGGHVVVNLLSDGELEVGTLRTSLGQLAASSVTFNVNDGILSTIQSASLGTNTTVNLQNGFFHVGGSNQFLSGAKLNWTGGSLNILTNALLAFDGGTGTFASSNSGLTLSTGSTLRVSQGGSLRTNSFLDLANSESGATSGSLIVMDPGSSLTSTSAAEQSIWAFGQGDVATVSFSNSGVGSFAGGVQIGPDGGAASIGIQSSARLSVGSLAAGRFSGASDGVDVHVAGGTLVVNGSADLNNGTTIDYSSGSIGIAGQLTMTGSAKVLVTAGANNILRTGGLGMGSSSKIDLADGKMIVGYSGSSPVETIREYLALGYHNGLWNGNGLTSSTAAGQAGSQHKTGLGYVDDGATSVTIDYALFGDADLNKTVDTIDFNLLAANFGQTNKTWFQGDFDYNASVDTVDFNLLASNFAQSLPAGGTLGSLVPEPGSAGLMAIAAIYFSKRQRRRRPLSN